jgi:hypothetical protein
MFYEGNNNDTKLINLTMNDINIYCDDGQILTILKSGQFARCVESCTPSKTLSIRGPFGSLHNVTTNIINMGTVTGLPPERPNTIYIVSFIVAKALPNRKDLCYPGPLISEDGHVLGCKGLSVIE